MNFKAYWNNVCLLSTWEQKYISDFLKKCEKENNIIFEYYGLGRKMPLSEKIVEELSQGTVKADLIVSTDLDIFQDRSLLTSVNYSLSHNKNLLPVRKEIQTSNIIDRSGYFAPFIIIPLVFVINTNLIPKEKIPNSFEQLLEPYYKNKIAFGGIHNSAGKSLLKSVWYLFGREKAEQFAKNSIITSMPAAAFQKVMAGEVPIAVVPTIFAMRAGIRNIEAVWPKEGAVAIPSYTTVRNDANNSYVKWISENILGKSHQELLKSKGAVIPCHPDVELPNLAKENNCTLLYPDWNFLHDFDNKYFYSLCEQYYKMLKGVQ